MDQNLEPQNLQPAPSNLLPLDAPERTVVMWSKGAPLRHVLRHPTNADVIAYFKGFVTRESAETKSLDVQTPALALYRALAVRAEGYGSGVLSGEALARVPVGHRIGAINALGMVEEDPDALLDFHPEFDSVALRAAWGERWFSGLVHHFAPLTQQEELKLSRELNRCVVVGGSRKGETIHALRQEVLLPWWDLQIRAVAGYEGYTYRSTELISRMCPFHKLAAMERWLAGPADVAFPVKPGEVPNETEEAAAA